MTEHEIATTEQEQRRLDVDLRILATLERLVAAVERIADHLESQ